MLKTLNTGMGEAGSETGIDRDLLSWFERALENRDKRIQSEKLNESKV